MHDMVAAQILTEQKVYLIHLDVIHSPYQTESTKSMQVHHHNTGYKTKQ